MVPTVSAGSPKAKEGSEGAASKSSLMDSRAQVGSEVSSS
jgi:hypothetical protein